MNTVSPSKPTSLPAVSMNQKSEPVGIPRFNLVGPDSSRLFEAGFAIEQVSLVTGHKDWKMLRRYTHIRPETLHRLAASRAPSPLETRAAE